MLWVVGLGIFFLDWMEDVSELWVGWIVDNKYWFDYWIGEGGMGIVFWVIDL